MRPVFVVGCPRSGTSWVRNILGRHPAVHAGPESHVYPTVHGVVRTWRDDPPRWVDVIERSDRMADHGGSGLHRWIDRPSLVTLVDRAAAGSGSSMEKADIVVDGVLEHFACRLGLGPAAVLVEKTPDHLSWADRILTRFLDARILEVRRDGRDACVSMERRAQTGDMASA